MSGGKKGAGSASAAKPFIFPALIFFIALFLRVAAVLAISNFESVTGYENEEIALNLIAGRGYSWERWGALEPTAFMYPLYTFFLAGHFLVFGRNWAAVELSQALLGACGVFLIYFLARRLFDRTAAAFSALIYACYPVYVYWCTQGQALVIEVVLLMALTLAWHLALRGELAGGPVIPGALLGLCGLSKTLYLVLFPSYVLWTRLEGGLSWRQTIRFSGVALGAALLVIAPWSARNAVRFHRFILVTDNTGYNLWLGNNPHASGGLYTPSGKHVAAFMSSELRAEVKAQKDSPSRDDVFLREAASFIRRHPERFVALVPLRLRALWFFDPYLPSRFGRFRVVVYLFLLVPAIAGMILQRNSIKTHSLFYFFYISITGVYAVFFGQARFRFAFEWTFIIFAAAALAEAWNRWFRPRAAIPARPARSGPGRVT